MDTAVASRLKPASTPDAAQAQLKMAVEEGLEKVDGALAAIVNFLLLTDDADRKNLDPIDLAELIDVVKFRALDVHRRFTDFAEAAIARD